MAGFAELFNRLSHLLRSFDDSLLSRLGGDPGGSCRPSGVPSASLTYSAAEHFLSSGAPASSDVVCAIINLAILRGLNVCAAQMLTLARKLVAALGLVADPETLEPPKFLSTWRDAQYGIWNRRGLTTIDACGAGADSKPLDRILVSRAYRSAPDPHQMDIHVGCTCCFRFCLCRF